MSLLDLAEHKRTEELYRSVVELAPDSIVTVDMKGVITSCNTASTRILGYSEDELIGKRFSKIRVFRARDIPKFLKLFKSALRGELTEPLELTLYRKDGTPILAEVRVGVLKEGGKTIGLQAISRDITERKRAEEELRVKESAIVSFINAIAFADLEGNLTYVNPSFLKLWGYDDEKEALGRPAVEFWQMEEKALEVVEALRDRGSWIGELVAKRKDGSLFDVQLSASMVTDEAGKPICMMASFVDITEGKRAEEGLVFERSLLRALLDYVPDSIYFKDEENRFLRVSKSKAEDLGVERDEIIGKTNFDFYPQNQAEQMFEDDKWVMEEGEPIVGKVEKVVRPDGNERWVSVTKIPRYDEDGNVVGALGISRDITERKRAEEEIRTLNQFLDSVIDNANVWLDVLDEKANVVIWNRAAEEISGYSREEVVGHDKIWEWLYPDEEYRNEIVAEAVAIIERGGEERDAETAIRRKDGQTRIISWHSRNLVDEKCTPIGSIAIGRDVTEHKRAEEEAQKRLREVTALHKVAEVITSTLDLKEVFQRVVEELSNAFGYRLVDIYLLEEDGLRLQANVGYDAQTTIELIPLERGVVGRVARTGQPAFIPDVTKDPDYIPAYPEIRSEICGPIISSEELLGTLNVESDAEKPLTDDDLQLLSTLSRHIGVAIENARLFEGERRKATQLAVINEVSKKAISILDLDEMLEEGARSICKGFDYYNATLFLVDKERHEAVMEAVAGGFEHIAPGEYRQSLDQGIIGWVIRTGRSWLANDVSQDPYYIKGFLEEVLTKSELCVPIELGGEVIGALDIQSIHLNAFDETDVTAMETLSGQIAIAIQNARLYEETKRLAATDPLTGVWNRRHIEERLRTEVARASRFHHPLSVLVMDIDNLKLFNDTYGHLAGDNVIRTVAQVVLTSCREIDIVGRYGGDEFAVILPEADARGAAKVADRILAALEKEPFQAADRARVPIRMSIGAASYASDSDDADRLFSLADAAMYRVKVAGGGQFASLMVGPEEVPEGLAAPFDVLQGLLIAVDTKDRYTFKHSQEVTKRALALARAVGLSEEQMTALEVAGKLHDVGKIGVPPSVLRKPGALTPEEWKTIQEHPRLGHLILQQLPQMETVLQAVLHHHERWDGSGYPSGLAGENIPLLSRILAVADAFSAMMTDRPYRKALTLEETLEELRRNVEKQFDPVLARKFIELVEKGEIEWRSPSGPSSGPRRAGG